MLTNSSRQGMDVIMRRSHGGGTRLKTEADHQRIQNDIDAYIKAGGRIKQCTTADNAFMREQPKKQALQRTMRRNYLISQAKLTARRSATIMRTFHADMTEAEVAKATTKLAKRWALDYYQVRDLRLQVERIMRGDA